MEESEQRKEQSELYVILKHHLQILVLLWNRNQICDNSERPPPTSVHSSLVLLGLTSGWTGQLKLVERF